MMSYLNTATSYCLLNAPQMSARILSATAPVRVAWRAPWCVAMKKLPPQLTALPENCGRQDNSTPTRRALRGPHGMDSCGIHRAPHPSNQGRKEYLFGARHTIENRLGICLSRGEMSISQCTQQIGKIRLRNQGHAPYIER